LGIRVPIVLGNPLLAYRLFKGKINKKDLAYEEAERSGAE
jgi:hypothetical protein